MQPIAADGVAWSVCLLVMTVNPSKVAEPIVMLFRMLTLVGPRNHVLDGIQIRICEGAILRAKRGCPRTCLAVDMLKATHQGLDWYGTDADWVHRAL